MKLRIRRAMFAHYDNIYYKSEEGGYVQSKLHLLNVWGKYATNDESMTSVEGSGLEMVRTTTNPLREK